MMPGIGLDGLNAVITVSCARGGVVDEPAASMALESRQLTSLALMSSKLSRLQRVTCYATTPSMVAHILRFDLEAQARIGTEMAGLLIEYFETGRCNNSLN